MTIEEVKQEMACSEVKEGKDFNGEKVLIPVYKQLSYIGIPLYAFGDGTKNGWEIGDEKKCFAYFDSQNKKSILANKMREKRSG